MKWIGQNIQGFISRFRQKVYIESGDIEVSKVTGQPTLELSGWSATATAAHAGRIKFLKSGTAAVDTFTAGNHTTAGEILGRIEAYGVDDGDGETLSSYIEFANDAISDADSSPGKIVFATSDADDAGTPTARLTIDDDGLATFSGAISVGGNLTFDSVALTGIQTSAESFVDNDVSIMTSAAIADKIEAYGYSTTSGDITGVTIQTDSGSGSKASDTAGSADFVLVGGGGIDVTNSGATITVAGELATDSNQGIANFSNNFFGVDAGEVSLATAMTWAATTITTDAVTFTSANVDDPLITIKNTHNSAAGDARIDFVNSRGAAGQDADTIGALNFKGYNDAGTPEIIQYGTIKTFIDDATDGEESGALKFGVASHDGSNDFGLILTGGSQSNEVDVSVGLGTSSTTTIQGNLKVIGTTYKDVRVYGTKIKILPADFMANEDPGATRTLQFDDTAPTGIKPGHADTELLAMTDIPEGMKATHVDVYAAQNLDIECFELDINASGVASKGTGTSNTTLDITDVNATQTNYLMIVVTTTATGNRVWGADVTIAPQ